MMCGRRNEAETVKRQVPRVIMTEGTEGTTTDPEEVPAKHVHEEELHENREFRERNHLQHTFNWVQRCSQN